MGTTSGGRRTRDPSAVLFGRTRRRVLGWLFNRPDQKFYLRQIARESGASLGAVQRELQALVEAGILRRNVEGRQVYFQVNLESPIFPELQGLLQKTAGIVDVVREALAPLRNRIRAAFVFGSAARGELRSGSDIDLLVVGDVSFGELATALIPAQSRLGRDVNPTAYPPEDFRRKIKSGHHFLTTVLREPRLFVLGDAHELIGLGAEQMAPSTPDEPERDSRPHGRRRPRPLRQRR